MSDQQPSRSSAAKRRRGSAAASAATARSPSAATRCTGSTARRQLRCAAATRRWLRASPRLWRTPNPAATDKQQRDHRFGSLDRVVGRLPNRCCNRCARVCQQGEEGDRAVRWLADRHRLRDGREDHRLDQHRLHDCVRNLLHYSDHLHHQFTEHRQRAVPDLHPL